MKKQIRVSLNTESVALTRVQLIEGNVDLKCISSARVELPADGLGELVLRIPLPFVELVVQETKWTPPPPNKALMAEIQKGYTEPKA